MNACQYFFSPKHERPFDGKALEKAAGRVIENQNRYYCERMCGKLGIIAWNQ